MTPTDLQKLSDLDLIQATQKHLEENVVRAVHAREMRMLLGEYVRRLGKPYAWMDYERQLVCGEALSPEVST